MPNEPDYKKLFTELRAKAEAVWNGWSKGFDGSDPMYELRDYLYTLRSPDDCKHKCSWLHEGHCPFMVRIKDEYYCLEKGVGECESVPKGKCCRYCNVYIPTPGKQVFPFPIQRVNNMSEPLESSESLSPLDLFLKELDLLSRRCSIWITGASDAELVDGEYNVIATGLDNDEDTQEYFVDEELWKEV